MKVKLDEGAYMPKRAHKTDAGYDLFLLEGKATILPAGGSVVIDTGVHIELLPGKCAVIISKSGLYLNKGISSTGLVDEGFTGSIKVGLRNHGDKDYIVYPGDKIAQFVIMDYRIEKLEQVDELAETERGDNGYGSTGR